MRDQPARRKLPTSWWIRALEVLGAGGSLLVSTGCTAQVETARPVMTVDGATMVQVDGTPARIESYPHTEYRGEAVYLVDGRWYRPRGRRWYYYREEPPELVRHRQFLQQAPPARAYPPPPHPGDATRVR